MSGRPILIKTAAHTTWQLPTLHMLISGILDKTVAHITLPNYSCVFGKRNYRVLVRVCVFVCVCVCVSVFVCVCVCFCTITQKEINLGTRNWNTW